MGNTPTYKEMRTDFKSLIDEIGNEVTFERKTATTDSLGGVTSSTSVISGVQTSHTIKCIMQPITEKDRDIHSMGLAEPGNRKVFFKHEYDSDDDSDISGTITPTLGDEITDSNSIKWRIIQILKKSTHQDYDVFIKAIIRREE